ncbi:MAG: hypothetical protein LWX07_10540 [Bacteroidetes bacterium]|nr:hypothetical protein [Bacteroidota bacterium]
MKTTLSKTASMLLLLSAMMLFSVNLYSQTDSPHFYFCESYKDGQEINVSNTFSTGYLTAMLDLRPMEITIGVSDVALEITMIADEHGFYDAEQVIDVVKFTVDPGWDYIYFTDEENLKFDKPGVYRVMLMKEPNEQIASGLLKITSK